MTFASFEESVESARPVELYKFTIGSEVIRYTSAEDDHIPPFDANTYFARQISRNSPNQSNEDRRQTLEVSLPADDALSSRFIGVPPGSEVQLEITRYHRGDSEAYVIWQGKIVGAGYTNEGAVCVLTGVTDESAFSRTIPRYKYQGLCNHTLYDSLCTVTKSSYKHTGVVSAASANTVEVTGLVSAKGAGWAVGGYIDNGNSDYRQIIAQSGDTLTLYVPFESSPLGASVDVYAGCDHTIDTCDSKFSNAVNFGGFPFVPTFNPFTRGL